jgi:hypothetical protein
LVRGCSGWRKRDHRNYYIGWLVYRSPHHGSLQHWSDQRGRSFIQRDRINYRRQRCSRCSAHLSQ